MNKENDIIKREIKEKNERYDSLTFTDDFLFCMIMLYNEDLCKELVEIITGKKIDKVVKLYTQETIKLLKEGKGVRLDVVFEDEDEIFDIEMQTTKAGLQAKRSRYYGSMIDGKAIKAGEEYTGLKNRCVIFICTQDPFLLGFPKYTFQNTCLEQPMLRLQDGTKTIFVNAIAPREIIDVMLHTGVINKKLVNLISYINGETPKDSFTKRIDDKVKESRKNEEWRGLFMVTPRETDIRIISEESFAKGLTKGQTKGHEEVFEALREQGFSEEVIEKIKGSIKLSSLDNK